MRPGTSAHWLDAARPPLIGVNLSGDAEQAALGHGYALAMTAGPWPPRSLYDVRVGIQWQGIAATLDLHRHVLATRRALGLICGQDADFARLRCVATAGHFGPCDYRGLAPRPAPPPRTESDEALERIEAVERTLDRVRKIILKHWLDEEWAQEFMRSS